MSPKSKEQHVAPGPCHRIAITGGPSAGKTALLEVVRRNFSRIGVLPEAASIIFGGGFPRVTDDEVALRAAQRAIYHVQCELERYADESGKYAVVLCDRGTLDGLAYWPNGETGPNGYFDQLGTTEEAELARYHAVIHLRTPGEEGYDATNPLRIEGPEEAALLDEKIAHVWRNHPNRVEVNSSATYLEKLNKAVAAILQVLPPGVEVFPEHS
mgnify:CR=1 FL=1